MTFIHFAVVFKDIFISQFTPNISINIRHIKDTDYYEDIRLNMSKVNIKKLTSK